MQPDLFVIALPDGRRPEYPYVLGDLLLTIEVVSPGSRRADHHIRRRAYLDAGVPVYWIVDPEARHVERWRPGDERPELLADEIEWLAPGFDQPLVISLPELFRAAIGDD
jgi:Uma2 family endonuclease